MSVLVNLALQYKTVYHFQPPVSSFNSLILPAPWWGTVGLVNLPPDEVVAEVEVLREEDPDRGWLFVSKGVASWGSTQLKHETLLGVLGLYINLFFPTP
jgi:hypothetical protein